MAQLIPRVERAGPRTVALASDDYVEAYRGLSAICILGSPPGSAMNPSIELSMRRISFHIRFPSIPTADEPRPRSPPIETRISRSRASGIPQ
jgi:hypothetical protein